MSKTGSAAKVKLNSFDDLFSSAASSDSQIQNIPVNMCVEYHNHKFNVHRSDYEGLVQSVKDVGVLQPILVRPYAGEYEVLAGHRRLAAAKEAGLSTIPAVVHDYDDNAAWLIVSASNFYQSSITEMAPSEVAKVVTDFYQAMKSNNANTELLAQVSKVSDKTFDSDNSDDTGRMTDKVGENFKISARSVSRYIRVNMLTDSLKNLLDAGRMSIRAAVDISFIDIDLQDELADMIEQYCISLTMKMSATLKSAWQDGQLDSSSMQDILVGKKKPAKKSAGFKPMKDLYARYFSDDMEPDDVYDVVDRALAEFFKNNKHKPEE